MVQSTKQHQEYEKKLATDAQGMCGLQALVLK